MMEPKVTNALIDAIAKWDLIAHGIESESSQECPLCEIFYYDLTCAGCPICEKTGKKYCSGTPYSIVNLYSEKTVAEDLATYPKNPPNLDAIEAEIEFLIDLLPEGEKGPYDLTHNPIKERTVEVYSVFNRETLRRIYLMKSDRGKFCIRTGILDRDSLQVVITRSYFLESSLQSVVKMYLGCYLNADYHTNVGELMSDQHD